MCGMSKAQAQTMPRAPGAPAPSGKIEPEEWGSVMQGLKELEDPNPERFKPTRPLFPERAPPGKSDGGSEDEKKRKQAPEPATPYLGS